MLAPAKEKSPEGFSKVGYARGIRHNKKKEPQRLFPKSTTCAAFAQGHPPIRE